jgi:hypothetical protein
MNKQAQQVADSGKVRLGGVSSPVVQPAVKDAKKVADAGKVRIGGYSPPVVQPAVKDAKKVRTGAMSPSF